MVPVAKKRPKKTKGPKHPAPIPLYGLWSEKDGDWVSDGMGRPLVGELRNYLCFLAGVEKYRKVEARVVRLNPQGEDSE